jgi:uncharacterized RDD family membrane protein YckC
MNGAGGVMERLDTLQAVELAEGVEVRLRVAGPLPRMLAYGLDLLICLGILIGLGMLMGLFGLLVGGRVTQGLMLLVSFLVTWWYPVWFEAGARGATPGKRALGLRVVQPTGVPINFGQAVVRNFLRFVDLQPMPTGLAGMACCFSTRRFQRLGDLAAGRGGVYDRRGAAPGPPPQVPARSSALRPPVALRPEEARAMIAFRDRARDWSEARRRELAGHLEPLTGEKATKKGVAKLIAMAQWLQNGRWRETR